MAADNWKRYNKAPEYLGDGTMDMDEDTFMLALFLFGSNCATLTQTVYGGLTSEHAQQYGYITGGEVLDSVTWTESSGVLTFDCAPEVFTASGGPITCRYAVIYSASAPSDELLAFSLLDNTPADVTASAGNTLTIDVHANGIVTISGGQS